MANRINAAPTMANMIGKLFGFSEKKREKGFRYVHVLKNNGNIRINRYLKNDVSVSHIHVLATFPIGIIAHIIAFCFAKKLIYFVVVLHSCFYSL